MDKLQEFQKVSTNYNYLIKELVFATNEKELEVLEEKLNSLSDKENSIGKEVLLQACSSKRDYLNSDTNKLFLAEQFAKFKTGFSSKQPVEVFYIDNSFYSDFLESTQHLNLFTKSSIDAHEVYNKYTDLIKECRSTKCLKQLSILFAEEVEVLTGISEELDAVIKLLSVTLNMKESAI